LIEKNIKKQNLKNKKKQAKYIKKKKTNKI
jgi:hypothetical protein